MGNDPFVDFPARCWLWVYMQPLQRFSSLLVSAFSALWLQLRPGRVAFESLRLNYLGILKLRRCPLSVSGQLFNSSIASKDL